MAKILNFDNKRKGSIEHWANEESGAVASLTEKEKRYILDLWKEQTRSYQDNILLQLRAKMQELKSKGHIWLKVGTGSVEAIVCTVDYKTFDGFERHTYLTKREAFNLYNDALNSCFCALIKFALERFGRLKQEKGIEDLLSEDHIATLNLVPQFIEFSFFVHYPGKNMRFTFKP